jgi:hypothetical protein
VKKTGVSEAQIVVVLGQQEAGMKPADMWRKHVISSATHPPT